MFVCMSTHMCIVGSLKDSGSGFTVWRNPACFLILSFSFEYFSDSDLSPIVSFCLLLFRWYPGDRVCPHQDVHEAQEHRSQAEAVLEVRSTPPRISDALADCRLVRKWQGVWHVWVTSPYAVFKAPQPTCHHSPSLPSLSEQVFVGHPL